MSIRSGTRIAAAICALGVVLSGVSLRFSLGTTQGAEGWLLSVAFLAVFGGVGFLVVSRQPRNPIGWIFCFCALMSGLSDLSDAYARYWLDGDGVRFLGEAAAAYENAGWAPLVLVPATFLLLLFPNGRLLSPRWRWVARVAALGIAGLFLSELTQAGDLDDFPGLQNPYGIDHPLQDLLQGGSWLVMPAVLIASPASLYLRFRRASGQERQQVKWLAWAGMVAGFTVVTGSSLGYAYAGAAVTNVVILLSVLALPVATGVAILRYRLYDVDVVINRTLVYGALTATLAAAYLGLVLLLQLGLSPLTENSGLAVAGSTLAVAGLFRPARSAIQAAVDRRFFRRRYDAARTLESFSARLRDELELGALTGELRRVAAETMQPAHLSLWLRTPEGGR